MYVNAVAKRALDKLGQYLHHPVLKLAENLRIFIAEAANAPCDL